jgi:hypothetical protein
MEKEESNKGLALVQKLTAGTPDVLNLDLRNNLEQSLTVLTNIVKSKTLGKINTVEGALSYYVKAKELGIPFISSVDHMFDVGGKTNVDVHLMRAMVLRAGVIHWEEIYNYAPLYKYADSTNRVVATGINEDCLPDVFELPKGNSTQELAEDVARIKSIGKTPVFKTMDVIPITATISKFNYATKYRFTRYMKLPNGTEKELVEYGEFTLRDAVTAGLHLFKDGNVNTDSPWLIYLRNMLEHRAWTFGGRKIADDILFGLLERTEYLDMEKTPYTIEEGRVTIIQGD